MRLTGALAWFAHFANHAHEGRSWLLATLQRSPEPTPARAKALWGAGLMAMILGDFTTAHACFAAVSGETEEALALLEVALAKGQLQRGWARIDPEFAFIGDDPRFQRLIDN